MTRNRFLLVAAIAALLVAFFALGLDRYLSLEAIQAERARLVGMREASPLVAGSLYAATYIVMAALSLPGALVMTLVGGALFGPLWGTVLVSFASSIGATAAFVVARYLLRDTVQARYGERLAAINEGVAREGGFYLFTLRLVPVVPFVVVNLAMALTPLRTPLFYGVSQLGMLPATVVYVNAGTQLATIDSLSGIVSPAVIASFAALGLFPLAAKKMVDHLRRRRG